MSVIDSEMDRFFGRIASLRWDIENVETWMADYESKRPNYPAWETKDGRHIWIYEIEDSHLDNLIPFVQRKDPENQTHWVDVFRAEKKYRQLAKELPRMKEELANMEFVLDMYL